MLQFQFLRASIPVFTCILAVPIEGKEPTQKEAIALVVLTIGVVVAVWEGTVAGSPRAVALCLAGTVSNALMMTMSGKVLSDRVDALRLTFYTAPVSLTALLPALVASGEASRFINDYLPIHGRESTVVALATSVIALSYNVVHSLMIQRTSVLGDDHGARRNQDHRSLAAVVRRPWGGKVIQSEDDGGVPHGDSRVLLVFSRETGRSRG